MSRKLDDLSPRFRPLAITLIARIVEAGIAVVIVNTRRTAEEQAINIANGASWTTHSKHLTGDAIDLAPFEMYDLHGPDKIMWSATDPTWLRMGKIGESLGLRWGGRWQQQDMGHFEYPDIPAGSVQRRA
jgi:hypothetical protein